MKHVILNKAEAYRECMPLVGPREDLKLREEWIWMT